MNYTFGMNGTQYVLHQALGSPEWVQLEADGKQLLSLRPAEFRMLLDWINSFEQNAMTPPEKRA